MGLIENFFGRIKRSEKASRDIFLSLEQIKDKEIKESLIKELNKGEEEETTIQIRLFDDKTGSVTYKQLTKNEFLKILKSVKNINWIYKKR